MINVTPRRRGKECVGVFMPVITISKQYKWLHRVPKHAIVNFLQDKDEPSVREAIRKLDNNTSGTILSILIKFDSKQLIYIFQTCTMTTPEEAYDLYRQYRYRGMKNLHLYSREGKCNLHSLNKSALNRVISTKASELIDSSKKFCNLEVSKIESIDRGSIREFLLVARMSSIMMYTCGLRVSEATRLCCLRIR